jgi:CRISPR-associated protein (TIGR03986 family)
MTGQIQDGQLSADLKKLRDDKRTIDQLNGVDVEFELEGTILKQIRRKGETFVAAAAPPPQSAQHRGQQGRDQTQRGRKDSRTQSQPASQKPEKSMPESAFHNPYNFVPAPPRQTDHPDLGDHAPIGQHVLHPDRYTGVIRVKMTVQTPLLLPDAAMMKEYDKDDSSQGIKKDHKSFPVRVDADGKPYLPPTSIKGMLRSAYEAVTNSRLAVFPGVEASQSRDATGHGARLAFRRPARVEVVPARIEACDAQQLTVRILSQLWLKSAAKLPRYVQRPGREQRTRKGEAQAALRYPDGSLPQHGDHVRVTVNAKGRVERIVRFEGSVAHEGDEGWVLITEPNIGNKKYERVYVVSPKDRLLQFQGADALQIRQMWNELINDYRQTHVKDLDQRRQRNQQPTDYLGDTPGQTAWSRQIWDDRYRQLHEGTLCYVRLNGSAITGIYPVSISRDLYSVSPLSLLHPSLRPATSLSQLSPADRVFGWVNQQGHGSYKGNVRVGPVKCETPKEQAIADFGTPGLPLAILGQPKPQQARFYVAKTPNGEAQGDRLSKQDAGYSPGKGLRGRKVYPHHQGLPDGHWDNAMQDRTQQADNGHFQEYRRPRLNGQEQRDNQNRSIQGWVKPGTVFRFDLHVTNLSKVELGALLWLLSLPDNRFHRLGGGKPLGFGSVRLEIDAANTRLYDGHGWKEIYGTLDDTTPPETNRDEIVRAFQEAVRTSYGSPASFKEVRFIAAWLKMATGHSDNLPTHYPRARQEGQNGPVPPNPEGLAYEWFVANDRTGHNGGPRVSLPDLANDSGLPMLDAP